MNCVWINYKMVWFWWVFQRDFALLCHFCKASEECVKNLLYQSEGVKRLQSMAYIRAGTAVLSWRLATAKSAFCNSQGQLV